MFVVFSVSLADDSSERTVVGKLKPLDVARLVVLGNIQMAKAFILS
jgi:hypothetical protein